MYEVDFIPAGDGQRSGDAIAMRFIPSGMDRPIVVVVDAGFESTGKMVVDHIKRYYGTGYVDLVVSTHPDLDHIAGFGVVVRELEVGALWIHRPALHGYPQNSGSRPAEELAQLASAKGATLAEPFTGVNAFDGALVVAGPTPGYYEQLLAEQQETEKAGTPPPAARLVEAAKQMGRKVLSSLPTEMFFDDAGGTNPRNNSSVILDLHADGERFFFPADAGVPAITQAMDALDSWGRSATPPRFFQMAHHGSRHNLDRDCADRLLGGIGQIPPIKTSFVNVAPESDMPSARINNAIMRRGYNTFATRGQSICHGKDALHRDGWVPLTPLPPMDETVENEGGTRAPAEKAA